MSCEFNVPTKVEEECQIENSGSKTNWHQDNSKKLDDLWNENNLLYVQNAKIV